MIKILSLIALSLAIVGCATTTSSTVTPSTNSVGTVTFTTNTVTTVNQANLDIDALALQSIVSLAVTTTIQKDPAAVTPITDIQVALTGIINGSNTNSVTQILNTAGANNPQLAAEIAPLVAQASSLEQNLITKYGATVGGQIALALAKAANAGITVGLAGK